MAVENFAPSLAKVLKHEGGYVNLRTDPGGATNRGVTQKVYDNWRKSRNLAIRSVKELTDDELRMIYRGTFWNAIHGDALPLGIDYVVFDGAVNSGPMQSALWLQRSLALDDDGKIGPKTIEAASKANRAVVIEDILARRLAYLKRIKHKQTGALLWTTFGKGWQARVDEVRGVALAMAAVPVPRPDPGGLEPGPSDPAPGPVEPIPEPVEGSTPAPTAPEVEVTTVTTVSHAKPRGWYGRIWGVIVAAIVGLLSFCSNQLFNGGGQ